MIGNVDVADSDAVEGARLLGITRRRRWWVWFGEKYESPGDAEPGSYQTPPTYCCTCPSPAENAGLAKFGLYRIAIVTFFLKHQPVFRIFIGVCIIFRLFQPVSCPTFIKFNFNLFNQLVGFNARLCRSPCWRHSLTHIAYCVLLTYVRWRLPTYVCLFVLDGEAQIGWRWGVREVGVASGN